jgi:S-adenosylmethionine decarboxylase
MNIGCEWVVEAEGCAAGLLSDLGAVRRVCERIISDLGLRVVGDPAWHKFAEPGGVTGLFLLTESHLACHTFPESGLATFNLYCCKPRPAWPWREQLMEMLGARRVVVRQFDRGAGIGRRDSEDYVERAVTGQEGGRQ